MSKKVSTATSSSASSLVARLEAIRIEQQLNCRGRRIPIQLIADALIKGGYNSLDDQAKALGLNRSTVWNIMKTKHKLGRLNNKTVRSILANTDTPPSVLVIIRSMLDSNSEFSIVGTSTVFVVRSRSISSNARSAFQGPTITVAAAWYTFRSMCMIGMPAAGMACAHGDIQYRAQESLVWIDRTLRQPGRSRGVGDHRNVVRRLSKLGFVFCRRN